MNKRIIALIICMSIGVFLTGCSSLEELSSHSQGEPIHENSPRFVYIDDGNNDDFEIIRDVETGVLYILYNDCFGHYGGLSPLYDSNGNIVVEED